MREFEDGSIQYNKLEGIFLQAGHKMGDHNVNRFLDMWDPEHDDDLLMWWKISYGIGQEEYKKSLTQAQIFSDTVLDPKNCCNELLNWITFYIIIGFKKIFMSIPKPKQANSNQE